eukprot:295838-Pelagomonas_calceolata.AAC.3
MKEKGRVTQLYLPYKQKKLLDVSWTECTGSLKDGMQIPRFARGRCQRNDKLPSMAWSFWPSASASLHHPSLSRKLERKRAELCFKVFDLLVKLEKRRLRMVGPLLALRNGQLAKASPKAHSPNLR